MEEIKGKADASFEAGIGGVKIKVGQPDWRSDLRRVAALREQLGGIPLRVDANQQWDRARARRMCRELEAFDLVWIEEPVDAWDAAGHADLSRRFDTPIGTGEMLTSVAEHMALVDAGFRGIVQPDVPPYRRCHPVPAIRSAGLPCRAGSGPRTTRWRSTCTSRRRTRLRHMAALFLVDSMEYSGADVSTGW
ncbi:MAG: enolase C-terminal domain-like protein [Micromonosporaceae bacterium]